MRTFVLGLHERPAELARCLAHLKERGIEGAEVVYGINAEVAGLSTSHTYDVDHPGTGFRIGTKLTGVYIGHYMLWTVCNALPDSHFLLLEYDVQLAENFRERMVQAIRDTPEDFDFLFLGSCCTKGHPTTHIKGEVFDVRYPQCNHAMLVAKKCLPYVLATQRKCYAPVDCGLIFHSFPALKVFTVKPSMASQLGTEYPE